MSDVYFESSETILTRMKSGITTVSTIEGSDVHNSQAPVSIELSNVKLQLDQILNKVFALRAYKNGYYEEFEERCNEKGIYKKVGTKATGYLTFKGQSGSPIQINTIIESETGLKYYTMDSAVIPDGATSVKVRVIAENIGSAYNKIANTITYLPIKLIGITGVTNEEDFTNGYDDESYESMYNRYIKKIQTPAASGNKYNYESWALEVTGTGSAKCIPAPGNVTVVIVDSNNKGASQELIQAVYSHIDEERPVLAGTLSVVSATEKVINVTANVKLLAGYNLGTVQEQFKESVDEYLKTIKFETKSNGVYVSINTISNLLYILEGISDFNSLLVNGAYSNVDIADTEIAVIGDVTLGIIQ